MDVGTFRGFMRLLRVFPFFSRLTKPLFSSRTLLQNTQERKRLRLSARLQYSSRLTHGIGADSDDVPRGAGEGDDEPAQPPPSFAPAATAAAVPQFHSTQEKLLLGESERASGTKNSKRRFQEVGARRARVRVRGRGITG